jgi:hypothetical protein
MACALKEIALARIWTKRYCTVHKNSSRKKNHAHLTITCATVTFWRKGALPDDTCNSILFSSLFALDYFVAFSLVKFYTHAFCAVRKHRDPILEG